MGVEVVITLFVMLLLVLAAFPAFVLPVMGAWYLRLRSDVRRAVSQVAADRRLPADPDSADEHPVVV